MPQGDYGVILRKTAEAFVGARFYTVITVCRRICLLMHSPCGAFLRERSGKCERVEAGIRDGTEDLKKLGGHDYPEIVRDWSWRSLPSGGGL